MCKRGHLHAPQFKAPSDIDLPPRRRELETRIINRIACRLPHVSYPHYLELFRRQAVDHSFQPSPHLRPNRYSDLAHRNHVRVLALVRGFDIPASENPVGSEPTTGAVNGQAAPSPQPIWAPRRVRFSRSVTWRIFLHAIQPDKFCGDAPPERRSVDVLSMRRGPLRLEGFGRLHGWAGLKAPCPRLAGQAFYLGQVERGKNTKQPNLFQGGTSSSTGGASH